MTKDLSTKPRGLPGKRFAAALGLLLLGTALATQAQAGIYNENPSGDLANSGLTPTAIPFTLGSNSVIGTTGNAGNGVDRDYFTFVIGSGNVLSAIFVRSGTATLGRTFFGISSGSTMTVVPTSLSAAGLLGWTLFGAPSIGTDILDDLGLATAAGFESFAGATGFVPPLGAGAYTAWLQDGDPGVASYSLDFIVTTVPEPRTWALMLAGLGLMAWQWRRKAALRSPHAQCVSAYTAKFTPMRKPSWAPSAG